MTTERWILIGIFVFFVFLLITFCYYVHRRLNRLEDTTQKLTNHVLLQQKVLDQHHSVLLPQSPESPLSGSGGGFDFVSIPSNPPPSFSSSHESSVTSSSSSPSSPPPVSSFFDGIIGSGGGSGGGTPPPLRMVGSLLNVLTSIQPPSSPVILHNDDDDEDEEVIQPVQELSPEEIKKELKKELDELDSPSSPSSSTPATIEPSKTIPVSSS